MKFQRAGDFHFRRGLWKGFLALGLWASLATVSFAQGETSIQGIVSDASGGTISGAAVRIKNLETGAERNQVTDEARIGIAWSPFARVSSELLLDHSKAKPFSHDSHFGT
jgi:hypothetical protein